MLNIRCTGQQVQMQTVDHEVGPRNMDGWPVIDLNFTETVDRDKSGTGTEYRNEKEDITAWLIHIQHISNYPLQIFCFLLKNNKRKKKTRSKFNCIHTLSFRKQKRTPGI